jgi:hypothetical protein
LEVVIWWFTLNVFMNSMLTFVLVMDSEKEITVQLLQSIDHSFPTVDSHTDQHLATERNWNIPHKYQGMCHTKVDCGCYCSYMG